MLSDKEIADLVREDNQMKWDSMTDQQKLDYADKLIQKFQLEAGSRWQHFKGNIYRVACVGVDSETLIATVGYTDEKMGRLWFRSLIRWHQTVELQEESSDPNTTVKGTGQWVKRFKPIN